MTRLFGKTPCHLIMKVGALELISVSSLTPAFCPKEGLAKTEEASSDLTMVFYRPFLDPFLKIMYLLYITSRLNLI